MQDQEVSVEVQCEVVLGWLAGHGQTTPRHHVPKVLGIHKAWTIMRLDIHMGHGLNIRTTA